MKLKTILPCLLLVFILTFPSPSVTQSRDSSRLYQVAVFPFMIHSQENLDYLREGINDILTSRIAVEDRVVVIDRSIVERALSEERPLRLDETAAAKIGVKVGADYIILGSVTKVHDYVSLDVRLISITEAKPPVTVYTEQKGIDDLMLKIGNFAQSIGHRILGGRALAGRADEPRYPLITHAFTVERIKYGDILRVYLEAEDLEGEMIRIGTLVDQAGYGRYPISWAFLKQPDRKHFKGYLQWNTFSSKASILSEGTPITLTVTVFGKSGRKSDTVAFPITFESGVKRASSYQLPSPFDQKDVKKLGNIDIELMDLTNWRQ